MSTPTFLLGVGAQKAGTSWLYQYLRRHPQAVIGPIKELGVFQTQYRPDQFRQSGLAQLRRLRDALDQAIATQEPGQPIAASRDLLHRVDNLAMVLDQNRYWGHFQRLKRRHPQARLFGDITPEYSGLTADNYAEIRAGILRGGFAPRVVFLMRDPIERCYSMFAMIDRNRARAGQPVPSPAHERFARMAVQDWCAIYTRYEQTVTALEAAFAPEELFFSFYESFFSPAEVARCTAFLGLDPHPPDLDHRANASPRSAPLDPGDVAQVRAFYAPTYEFCAARWGAGTLARIWKNA